MNYKQRYDEWIMSDRIDEETRAELQKIRVRERQNHRNG